MGQVGNLRAIQRVPRLTAAVPCQRGSWPIANRPQLIKLPHKASAHPRARSVFHGISRAERPSQQDRYFRLALNLNTTQESILGLTPPQKALLS